MSYKLPTFLLAGGSKCGTTSLYHYLMQHPEIFLPSNKEPRFFLSHIYSNLSTDDPRRDAILSTTVFSFDDYLKLYEGAENFRAVGEASATYFFRYDVAIPKITEYLNDPSILIFLRNPVDRAFSAYCHLVRDGCEKLSFEKCLALEESREKDFWSSLNLYKANGFYFQQVKNYIDSFSKVKVIIYDDFLKHQKDIMSDIYLFLGVDSSFIPNTQTKYNVSLIPKSKFIDTFFKKKSFLKSCLRPFANVFISDHTKKNLIDNIKSKNLSKPSINPKTREQLKMIFREDILKLQDLLDKNLSAWLD